jgi:hypothetical protein
MVNKITLFLLGTAIIVLAIDNIRLRYHNVQAKRVAIQAIIDQEIIKDAFDKKIGSSHVVDEERDSYESLIKFLSETRDLSFEFIEKCQTVVDEFVKEFEGDCAYFEKYGQAFNTGMPNDKVVEKLAAHLPKLKDLLPTTEHENLDG